MAGTGLERAICSEHQIQNAKKCASGKAWFSSGTGTGVLFSFSVRHLPQLNRTGIYGKRSAWPWGAGQMTTLG